MTRIGTILLALALGCLGARADAGAACDARRGNLDTLVQCLKADLIRLNEPEASDCVKPVSDAAIVGRRVLSFGETTQFAKPSKGIAIEAKAGATLHAPASGLILFAGEWRSYGPLVIIDAGCGRDVLMMGPIALGVAGGGRIARGDSIGHVSAPTTGVPPVIYYEVRQDGIAFDPGG